MPSFIVTFLTFALSLGQAEAMPLRKGRTISHVPKGQPLGKKEADAKFTQMLRKYNETENDAKARLEFVKAYDVPQFKNIREYKMNHNNGRDLIVCGGFCLGLAGAVLALLVTQLVTGFVVLPGTDQSRIGVKPLSATLQKDIVLIVRVEHMDTCTDAPSDIFEVSNNANGVGTWSTTGDHCTQLLSIKINGEDPDTLTFNTKIGTNVALEYIYVGIHNGNVRSLSGPSTVLPNTQGQQEKVTAEAGGVGVASAILEGKPDGRAVIIQGQMNNVMKIGTEPGMGVKTFFAQNKDFTDLAGNILSFFSRRRLSSSTYESPHSLMVWIESDAVGAVDAQITSNNLVFYHDHGVGSDGAQAFQTGAWDGPVCVLYCFDPPCTGYCEFRVLDNDMPNTWLDVYTTNPSAVGAKVVIPLFGEVTWSNYGATITDNGDVDVIEISAANNVWYLHDINPRDTPNLTSDLT